MLYNDNSEFLKDVNLTGKTYEITVQILNEHKLEADRREANRVVLEQWKEKDEWWKNLTDRAYYESVNLPTYMRKKVEDTMKDLLKLEFYTFKKPNFEDLP